MKFTTADGREFELSGERSYFSFKKHRRVKILQWRGACAQCGAPFTVTTPYAFERTNAFARRHCNAHKMTREQALKRARAAREQR